LRKEASLKKEELFRTGVIKSKTVTIERQKEIIKGFAVVTKGVTFDERGEFDDISLEKIIELGNKSKIGAKSRFGHPNMSTTALGTFLGRVKKFRLDGDIVRADLHIDPTAHDTPDGDLAGYVMDLAESDPEAFGASMVISWDEEFRKDKDGNVLKDDEGNELPPLIRVKKLFSVDVVDDPAANKGLFGMPFFTEDVKLSGAFTSFLDRFLEDESAVTKVIAFLGRYGSNRNDKAEKRGGKDMFEELTLEALQKERSDLFDKAKGIGFEEGKRKGDEEGVKKERDRAVSILKKAKTFKDMTDLAISAVEEGLNLDQATVKFQEKQLEGIKAAHPASPGPDNEDKTKEKKTHLERARAYKEEHNCSMTEALQATADKRK
jgi:hypothetical protein